MGWRRLVSRKHATFAAQVHRAVVGTVHRMFGRPRRLQHFPAPRPIATDAGPLTSRRAACRTWGRAPRRNPDLAPCDAGSP
jgi:hypothetical protein